MLIAVMLGAAAGIVSWIAGALVGRLVAAITDQWLQTAVAGAAIGAAFGMGTGVIEHLAERVPVLGWSGATAGVTVGLVAGAASGVLSLYAHRLASAYLSGSRLMVGPIVIAPAFVSWWVALAVIGGVLGAVEAIRRRSLRRSLAGAAAGVTAGLAGAATITVIGAGGSLSPPLTGFLGLAVFGATFGLLTSWFEHMTLRAVLIPVNGFAADLLFCGRCLHLSPDRMVELRRVGSLYAARQRGGGNRLSVNGRRTMESMLRHGDLITVGEITYRLVVR